MMRAMVLSTAWVLTGAGVFAALGWAFLNTPESTTFTLAASLLLVLLMFAALALTWGGALLGWGRGWDTGLLRRAFASVPAFVLPATAAAAAWWTVGAGLAWIDAHAGEISAWFIATADWSDVTWLIGAVSYLGEWLRLVAVPFVALAWFGHLLTSGMRSLVSGAPVRRALSPLRLLAATAVAVATLWAPLRYGLYWMPAGLPSTWVEPAVAVAKFGLMAVIGALGLSLIARLAAPSREPQG